MIDINIKNINKIKREYFPKLKILNDNEGIKFIEELEFKGLYKYSSIYKKVIRNKNEISWEELSQYYKYDIKLRRVIYKFIAFIEVAMRAVISNNYDIDEITKENISKKFKENISNNIKIFNNKKIVELIFDKESHLTLWEVLEKCDMNTLNKIVENIDIKYYESIFPSDKNLTTNLNALKEVRNCVMHQRILYTVKLNKVQFDSGEESSDLKANIINIKNHLPRRTQEAFVKEINNCVYINREESFYNDESEKYRIESLVEI